MVHRAELRCVTPCRPADLPVAKKDARESETPALPIAPIAAIAPTVCGQAKIIELDHLVLAAREKKVGADLFCLSRKPLMGLNSDSEMAKIR